MFLAKTGTVYRKSYGANRVSSRSLLDTIKCKLVSRSGKDIGIGGGQDYESFDMYTRTATLQGGDKVVVNSTAYIINDLAPADGTLLSYAKYLVKRSKGD